MKKLVIAALLAAGIVGVSAQGWDPSMGNTSMNLVSQTGYVTYGESAALVDPALVGTRIGSDFTGVIYYNDAVVATCNFGSVEKNGEILVIRPEKKLEIGRIEHNPDNLKKIYDIGRNLANRELQKVISFLNN